MFTFADFTPYLLIEISCEYNSFSEFFQQIIESEGGVGDHPHRDLGKKT